MSSQPTSMLTIFNDHFIEFITDICNIFPDNVKILTAKNALIAIRKANPKILPFIWIWLQLCVDPLCVSQSCGFKGCMIF